jgi:hypothetical protein
MPDETLRIFKTYLDARRVEKFPTDVLKWTQEQLVPCDKHSDMRVVYAKERKECPHCIGDRSVPDLSKVVVTITGIAFKLVFKLPRGRRPVFGRVVTDNPLSANPVQQLALFVADSHANLFVYWVNTRGIISEIKLPIAYDPQMEFDANDRYILVTNQGHGVLYSHQGEELFSLDTGMYVKRSVVSLGTGEPVWMIGRSPVKGRDFHGKLLSKPIQQPLSSTTWFTANAAKSINAGVESVTDLIVGFNNLPPHYRWFTMFQGAHTELPFPHKAGTPEPLLLDWQVVFSGSQFAVIRRLQQNTGLQQSAYVTATIFADGKYLNEEVLPVKDIHFRAALHNGSLMVPTEEGIYRIKAEYKHGEIPQVLKGTEDVSPSSRLYALNGILSVVDEDGSFYVLK